MPIKEFFFQPLKLKTDENRAHTSANKLNLSYADNIEETQTIHKMFEKRIGLLDQCVPDIKRNAAFIKE